MCYCCYLTYQANREQQNAKTDQSTCIHTTHAFIKTRYQTMHIYLYQQNNKEQPTNDEGGYVKLSMLERYNEYERPPKLENSGDQNTDHLNTGKTKMLKLQNFKTEIIAK